MKLNSKEQAWANKRKKNNIEHIKWGQKPELTFEERMQQVESVDPYSEEGQKLQEAIDPFLGYRISSLPIRISEEDRIDSFNNNSIKAWKKNCTSSSRFIVPCGLVKFVFVRI